MNNLSVNIRTSRGVLDEMEWVLLEVAASDPEDERYRHQKILEEVWMSGKAVFKLKDCPIDTAQWVASELRYFGDPCAGWMDDLMFRCKPFNRIAGIIEEAAL